MIQKVAIIGMGTMGPGMAARLVRGGIDVAAYDISADAIARAQAMIAPSNGVLDALGIAAPESGAGALSFTDDIAAAVAGADLVIENVPENEDIKAGVYREIDGLIGADTLVASDTSGIPISKLQAHISNPARMVGMHWSNPPHIIPMIEVIRGEETAPATVEAIRDFIRSLGLLPVLLKKDVPGFVENRVLYALLREVVDLVERDVIAPEDIDTCVSWGIGYKIAVIGPMALIDMAGMDIYHSVSSFLNEDLCDRKDVAPLVRDQIAAGKLGIKSGQGLYDYTPERIAELQAERARKLVAIRRIIEGRDRGDGTGGEEVGKQMTGHGIIRIEALIVRAISVLLGLGLIAMVLINVANAIGRYTRWFSLVGADELLVYGMIWIVMLGAILAARARDHLSINLLSSVAIGYNARILQIVVDLATLAVSAFIAWHSFVFIDRIAGLNQTSMGLGVPMVIPHSAIFVGFAGIAAVTAFLTVADILRMFRRKGRAS